MRGWLLAAGAALCNVENIAAEAKQGAIGSITRGSAAGGWSGSSGQDRLHDGDDLRTSKTVEIYECRAARQSNTGRNDANRLALPACQARGSWNDNSVGSWYHKRRGISDEHVEARQPSRHDTRKPGRSLFAPWGLRAVMYARGGYNDNDDGDSESEGTEEDDWETFHDGYNSDIGEESENDDPEIDDGWEDFHGNDELLDEAGESRPPAGTGGRYRGQQQQQQQQQRQERHEVGRRGGRARSTRPANVSEDPASRSRRRQSTASARRKKAGGGVMKSVGTATGKSMKAMVHALQPKSVGLGEILDTWKLEQVIGKPPGRVTRCAATIEFRRDGTVATSFDGRESISDFTFRAHSWPRACTIEFEARAFQGPWDEEPVWKMYKGFFSRKLLDPKIITLEGTIYELTGKMLWKRKVKTGTFVARRRPSRTTRVGGSARAEEANDQPYRDGDDEEYYAAGEYESDLDDEDVQVLPRSGGGSTGGTRSGGRERRGSGGRSTSSGDRKRDRGSSHERGSGGGSVRRRTGERR